MPNTRTNLTRVGWLMVGHVNGRHPGTGYSHQQRPAHAVPLAGQLLRSPPRLRLRGWPAWLPAYVCLSSQDRALARFMVRPLATRALLQERGLVALLAAHQRGLEVDHSASR